MTKEELMSLVKAGFTKEEIISLSATKEFTVQEPEVESKEVSEAEEVKEVVEAQANNEDALSKVNEAIESFTKKLESFNITNAEMVHENKGEEGLEDILARVLLPDGKEIK